MSNELIEAYREMAEMTLPECKNSCRVPLSCCSPEYCITTIQWAKDRWGVKLKHDKNARLPLMGPDGCTAAPHLRPACTMHTCDINSAGCKKTPELDLEWTERYFELRDKISLLEADHV